MLDEDSEYQHSKGKNHCCHQYDVRHLRFDDYQFYTSDFIFKFANINSDDVQTLTL